MTPRALTILHDGLGRDSRTMACLLSEGRLLVDGEHVGPGAVDAAVFADIAALARVSPPELGAELDAHQLELR